MRKYGILLAAALLCACTKPADDRNKVVVTPPTELQKLAASTRANYQIYQVNPKLFGSSGQLKGIQNRLDEIKALGTDILYIMPIYPEGKKNAFGSPYCIRDYGSVNPACGSLDDLKALVSAAHAKGMKVMLDWVPNHTAWDHAWITEHPDWYVKNSDGSIISPSGWNDVAQLDYSSEGLQNAMIAEMKYWIGAADIDGYRCDYAHGVSDAFWKKAIPELRAAKAGFLMLAESDYERLFDDGFDIIYDRGLRSAAIDLVKGGDPKSFVTYYKGSLDKTPAGKTKLHFVTNHDEAAEDSPVNQFRSKDGAFATFALLAALNGSPMIYSSQETGYAKAINFFQVTSVDWNADSALTGRYKSVMSALQSVSRDSACTVYALERIVFVKYEGSVLVGVNLSNGSLTSALPDRDGEYTFGAYEVKIWN